MLSILHASFYAEDIFWTLADLSNREWSILLNEAKSILMSWYFQTNRGVENFIEEHKMELLQASSKS